ncbi:NADH-quinone oxidoreductase subunit G [Pseudoxanthomonas sp. SORGH_AS 997]|nr:NADH-quinone oxidoreductase subunit G [Pseudoxanthomonas sp. SORGH_AS_0997]
MSAQPVDPNVPPDHVTIEIDGRVLYAPKGSMIIQAADKAGIPIPRFCYHDKLSIAANCRMCLVDTEVGGRPAPKPSPACATPVGDGLKVFTRNEKALKYQRSVMEFLLINHPLDCPICDQGGECELQDVSLGYGRSVSRFNERKRVVPDEDIGPLVATEMTRCIQCTRCVRFTAEVAGTYELGGMYRGENLQIGTYDGKPLTTELSGNVVDVCPVGALTNKVFQFRARPWELQARESLGFHDAMGSNLYVHVRRGEVLRTVPRDNEAVNECWLSDRDRYSHQGLYAADRAVKPLQKVDGEWKEVSWAEGLAAAAEILKAHAGDELGVLVHPATSNEEGGLVARLAAGLGSGNLDHRILANDLSDGAVAQPFGLPLAQIEKAGAIVVFGSNVRHELPLLHQRIRKAVRNGAKVHLVNPVDFDFTFSAASKTIVPPSQLADALGASALREAVQGASSAVVIVGALAENHPQAAALRKAAADFAAATGAARCRIPQGANAVGLARAGVLPSTRDAADMVAQPRAAYVIYGIEPGLDFAHGFATQKALTAAKVVAFSHFACASTRRMADVILPIGRAAGNRGHADQSGRHRAAHPGRRQAAGRGARGLEGAARPGRRAGSAGLRLHRSGRRARQPGQPGRGDAQGLGRAGAGRRGAGGGRHLRHLPHRWLRAPCASAAGPSAQHRARHQPASAGRAGAGPGRRAGGQGAGRRWNGHLAGGDQ